MFWDYIVGMVIQFVNLPKSTEFCTLNGWILQLHTQNIYIHINYIYIYTQMHTYRHNIWYRRYVYIIYDIVVICMINIYINTCTW